MSSEFRGDVWEFPGDVQQTSGKLPANAREVSGRCPVNFWKRSGKCPGDVREKKIGFRELFSQFPEIPSARRNDRSQVASRHSDRELPGAKP